MESKAIEKPKLGQETRLIFNDRLKQGIRSCHIPREAFKTDDVLKLSSLGTALRKYLRANEWRFDWIDGATTFSNPDYLAFALLFISDYDKYNCWDDFSIQFENPLSNGNIQSVNEMQGLEKMHCSCKKMIYQLFKFHNPDTEMNALIGSHCINTAFITNPTEKRLIEQQFEKKCPDCKRQKVRFNSDGKFSSACKVCSLTHRRCLKCDRYKIKNEYSFDYCWTCVNTSPYLGSGRCLI